MVLTMTYVGPRSEAQEGIVSNAGQGGIDNITNCNLVTYQNDVKRQMTKDYND